MKTTTYPGINYAAFAGPSTTNMDAETGIRYGIISQNDVNPDAMEDIYQNGRDLGFEQAQQNVKDNLRSALSDYFSDHKWSNEKTSKLDNAVESAFEAIQDELNDNLSMGCESGPYYLEQDGYAVKTDDHNDLWVLKSPYFTYAQFCSPCAPGACHLGNPLDVDPSACEGFTVTDGDVARGNNIHPETGKSLPAGHYATSIASAMANRCYALGHDWFEDSKAPYRLWSVETGEEIMPS